MVWDHITLFMRNLTSNKDHPDADYVILLDSPDMQLDWVIRSFRGYDCTGITLYQHRTFSGEAHHFTVKS